MRIRRPQMTRRRFLLGAAIAAPLAIVGDGLAVEPEWIRTRQLKLTPNPTHRLVHFTDLHHKGDRAYLERIVASINDLAPDFVCFTGDLIEDGEHLPEALELLAAIRAPLYGVPGNHDYWAKVPFTEIKACFARSDGKWLLDESVLTKDGRVTITGAANLKFKRQPLPPSAGTRHIFLMHYPAWVKKLEGHTFDLILAGHSHGGQVRIPFFGAPIVPFGVDEYEVGLFNTPAGPLYVNPGLGWFPVPFRLNCRPEITLFEL